MKADISENGCLYITPETPLEEYALNCWSEEFYKGFEAKGDSAVTFMITKMKEQHE